MRIGILSERPIDAHTLYCAVSLEPAHRIVWIAESGAAAIAQCATERPELILLNLPLAGTDAVDAVRTIKAAAACPVLIVADSVGRNAAAVLHGMSGGAVDVVDLPRLDSNNLRTQAAGLLAKIENVSRFADRTSATDRPQQAARTAVATRADVLVAIGASAGGPAAVASLLRGLPADFPAGIVVVQHIDEEFVSGMAEWLSDQTGRHVRVANEGDRPAPSCVLMAGAGGHLTLKNGGRVTYSQEPQFAAYCPSVDAFFYSASGMWPGAVVGVLLTGMGKDGALGLKALREKGHHTIAQDEASSAVYGMPKAAAALKAATEIRPLDQIASRLVNLVTSGQRDPAA